MLAKQKKSYDLYMPGTQKQIMEVVEKLKKKYTRKERRNDTRRHI